ncbi:MAG: HPr family phosphocarrier protein [Sphaerochaetaceae bacterium]|jgi:phosphocarrier protein HPr|nr:HPr family phosphocarrier protein [Sphaerochaetaceae bacterium]MDD3163756.1 HPr family phosphocarrier protein [Sphaerochaetaceae bacterium]MDD4007204.1 HPr family phosphocarrier protein [Sphaerochaetaceae bacterium]MDD4397346.1 HPr family phosphocarrier protein [Sphaerochaetaceae bacterium]
MIQKEIVVSNHAGIHTRPAALIARVASGYKSSLHFQKDSMDVNGKSVMGIITLGCPYKDRITMICDGEDEQALASAIEKLFQNKFEEQ